jgi:hypothetical protein
MLPCVAEGTDPPAAAGVIAAATHAPSPFVAREAVVGMAVYTAKAMLHGKGSYVWEMPVENVP